ncbi:MAG: GIY-YIG nuclease family protein [Candidatus Helarchaeota archaeon]
MSQGIYNLIIYNGKTQTIQIGHLGKFSFSKGLYIYVGSALGKTATNLKNRLRRHLSSKKTLHWHVDYLLNAQDVNIQSIIYAYTTEPKECSLASAISKIEGITIPINKFGASDCKAKCSSHLFYFLGDHDNLHNILKSAFLLIDLTPIEPKINNAHCELIL